MAVGATSYLRLYESDGPGEGSLCLLRLEERRPLLVGNSYNEEECEYDDMGRVCGGIQRQILQHEGHERPTARFQ